MKIDPIKAALFAYGLLLAWLLSVDNRDAAIIGLANVVAPCLVLIFGLAVSGSLAYRSNINILSPILWFYFTCAIFYGFGQLVFVFGRPETVSYINKASRYAINEYGLFETNILNVFGIFCISLSIVICQWLLFPQRHFARHTLVDFNLAAAIRVFWIFVAVGGFVKYFFSLPNALGLLSWTLPGTFQHLYLMLPAAIIIASLLIQRGMRAYIWPFWILVGSEIITNLMTYSKAAIMFTLIAAVVGRHLLRPSLKVLVASLAGLILLYVFVFSPFIAFARQGLLGADLGSVMDSLSRFFSATGGPIHTTYEMEVAQHWWARLGYANFEKFAIDAYNSGQSGDSLQQVYYALVPRALFPDKPIMSYGAQFSNLLEPGMGEWTLTGLGMFAEGYWNAGIPGIIGVCFWAGFVLAGFAAFTHRSLIRGRLAMLLVSLVSIQIGMGPDLWYASTYVGGAGEGVLYGTVLWLVFYRQSARTLRHGPYNAGLAQRRA